MSDNASRNISASVRLAREHNSVTRGAVACRLHRQRIMTLIEDALSGVPLERPSLTIVGPGNCNDIDLSVLARRCSAIQLVDLDSDAVTSAIEGCIQDAGGPSEHPCQFQVVSPFDFAAPLASSGCEEFNGPGLNGIIERLSRPLDSFDQKMSLERTDVVISTCVLSQILNVVMHVAGREIAQTPALLQAIRRSHIARMIELLKPDGTAILVSDFVSSDTLPSLKSTDETQLQLLIQQALHSGNFFSGLHPGLIVQEFQQLSSANGYSLPRIVPPWRWNLGPRTYAVFAVGIRK